MLLCAACTLWAAAKGWASFSILMCRKQEHGKDGPKPAESRKFLEKYLGKINTAIPDTSLSYTVHFNYQVFSVCDLPNPATTSTPKFDSELGIEVDTATVTVIPEVPEHSFYLMQWLRIGGTNHLIFFDRGANAHLVQGKMAVAAGFEITSSRPTSLTVVGGGSLKTEYGSYRFNLGPGAGGEYHEISCIGMDSVTSKFNKYDLSNICAEFTSLSDPNQSVPPLPKYVGGSEVHLLLGIKNTNLDLVWIKTLPSGVAVYQSVFKDIWGSDLIFAGPHKTFTNGNKTSNVNHVIFGKHSIISEPGVEDDIWTKENMPLSPIPS